MKPIKNNPVKHDANTVANFQYNFVKKEVKNHDKKRGNKRVVINKNDLDIEVGDEIYLITLNGYAALNKTIVDYESKINKLENDLKISVKNQDKNHEDNIHEIQHKHHQELEQLQQQHHQELDKLHSEINQLKQSNIETISKIKDKHQQELKQHQQDHHQEIKQLHEEIKQLQNQHQQEIKEYQQLNQNALDKQKELIDEITKLKAHEFDYATKYNNLRQSIKNVGWFAAVRNKHKDLLNEYPPIMLSDKPVSIEINKTNEQ